MRFRPTYANVTATLALVVALGGTSYAAALAANSVGTPQLRAGAVTGSKLASGAVSATKLASSAVTSAKVRDGSLTNADVLRGSLLASAFRAGQLPGKVTATSATVASPDFTPPATPTDAVGAFAQTASFTTAAAGRVAIDLTSLTDVFCTGHVAWWWIVLDDGLLPGSLQLGPTRVDSANCTPCRSTSTRPRRPCSRRASTR